MKAGQFIYTDLSTYDLGIAKQFYGEVFDWQFVHSGNDYLVATFEGKEVAGLYETPQKFKDMNMPSFWMSYIQVEDVDKAVQHAGSLGGTIELVDQENKLGGLALIRDPLGAGFTIYEGEQLNSRYERQPNALIWNELFISDIRKVKLFYERLFNWDIQLDQPGRYLLYTKQNKAIGAIQELSSDIKGNYEYWGVFFAAEEQAMFEEVVLRNGGRCLYVSGDFTAYSDPFGAFFHVVFL